MEGILIIVVTIAFALIICHIDGYFEKRCDILAFRIETLENEIEILKEYIEGNEEKQNDL